MSPSKMYYYALIYLYNFLYICTIKLYVKLCKNTVETISKCIFCFSVRDNHFLPNIRERQNEQNNVEDEFRLRMEIRRRLRRQKQAEMGSLSLADRIKQQRREYGESRIDVRIKALEYNFGNP